MAAASSGDLPFMACSNRETTSAPNTAWGFFSDWVASSAPSASR